MEQNNITNSPSNTSQTPTQPVVNEQIVVAPTQAQAPSQSIQPPKDAPRVIQPTLSNPVEPSRHKNHWIVMIIGLMIISAIVVAGYFFSSYNPKGYKISYSTPHYGPLKVYRVSMGDKEGVSELSVPTEFTDPSNLNSHKQSVNLVNNEVYNHGISTRQISLINLNSSPHKAFKSNFYQLYSSILANPKHTDYKNATAPLRTSVTSLLGSSYDYAFKPPQVYKSSNIKQNSWTMDFTATAKTPTPKMPDRVQGRVLTAFTDNNVYFLIAYAETNNWKANSSTWQQVFGSLKLNQQ